MSDIRPTLDVFPNNALCPETNSLLKLHYVSVKAIISLNSIFILVSRWRRKRSQFSLFQVKLLSSSLFSLCAVTACQLNSSKEFIEWMKQNGNHSDMKLKKATRTIELPNDSKSSCQVPEEVVRCCQLVFEELMSLCPNFLELAALKSIIVFYPCKWYL